MLKMLQGCLKSLEYIAHVSELRLENIIPPKEQLKRTNNESEDSKTWLGQTMKSNYCWKHISTLKARKLTKI